MVFPQSHHNVDYPKITYNSFSKPEKEIGLLKTSSAQTPTNVLTSNPSSSSGILNLNPSSSSIPPPSIVYSSNSQRCFCVDESENGFKASGDSSRFSSLEPLGHVMPIEMNATTEESSFPELSCRAIPTSNINIKTEVSSFDASNSSIHRYFDDSRFCPVSAEMNTQEQNYGQMLVHENNSNIPVQQTQHPTPARNSFEHIRDKELRKKMKNRLSAQAARDRKKAKMAQLESQIQTLMERNHIMQNENIKLRSQIQRMESSPIWKMRKQEQTNIISDPSFPSSLMVTQQLYDHRNSVSMPYTSNDSHGEIFPKSNEFPAYIHQGLQESNVDVHEANLVPFNQESSDNGDFHADTYTTPLWTSEAGSSMQRANLTSYPVNANFNS